MPARCFGKTSAIVPVGEGTGAGHFCGIGSSVVPGVAGQARAFKLRRHSSGTRIRPDAGLHAAPVLTADFGYGAGALHHQQTHRRQGEIPFVWPSRSSAN